LVRQCHFGIGLGPAAVVCRRRDGRYRDPSARLREHRDARLRRSYLVRHSRHRLGGEEVRTIEDLKTPLTGGRSAAQMTSISRSRERTTAMPPFFSPYHHNFIRLGACVPHVAVAAPARNAENVIGMLALGDRERVAVMVFPELCLSAYAIDDLLFQDAVLDGVEHQLDRLICAS